DSGGCYKRSLARRPSETTPDGLRLAGRRLLRRRSPETLSSGSVAGRRRKAVPLALEQLGKPERRSILEIRSDGLEADRQVIVVEACRECRRRQAAEDCDLGIESDVEARNLAAIDHIGARSQRVRSVRKGRARECGGYEHIPVVEERRPRLAQPF